MEATYRLTNNGNERLQYFSHIEFDIGYPARHTISTSSNEDMQSKAEQFYLSFDALTTRGSSFEEVISEPRTGANREIACRIVILYR